MKGSASAWESFEIEVVTPMFTGRDTTKSAEFRVPSFRGVLRFWFRFLAGHLVGYDLEKLRRAEAIVLGSTSTASTVRFRLPRPVVVKGVDRNPAWMPRQGGQVYDLRYLLGLGLQGWDRNLKRNQIARAFLPPRTRFEVEARWGEFQDLMRPVLWYAQTFGGIGARTTRGWGGYTSSLEWPCWADELSSRGKASDCFSAEFKKHPLLHDLVEEREPPELTAFPSVLRWEVNERDPVLGDDAWAKALNACGESHRHRRMEGKVPHKTTPTYRHLAKPFLRGEKLPDEVSFRVGAFGLPLVVRSRSEGGTATFRPKTPGPKASERELRRSSLVWFRVKEIDGGVVPFVVVMKCELLPSGAKIVITHGHRSQPLVWDSEESINLVLGSGT